MTVTERDGRSPPAVLGSLVKVELFAPQINGERTALVPEGLRHGPAFTGQCTPALEALATHYDTELRRAVTT